MSKVKKFGTFAGVFTPSILTILGVIMYLRLPYIVGEAGMWPTITIIVIAHIISFTTGLSVSGIATDKKVEAGGTYFMISRSLGLAIGGTLGLALFVGLSFSISLYLIGFAESFLGYFGYPTDNDHIRIVGSIMLLLVTIVTFISTSLALKTQFFIMAAIVLSLVSILLGQHDHAPEAPKLLQSEGATSLMVLFGIFFPAVTGFEAGVSMSGDLKDPKKSIPIGSISAIIVGFVVYILLTVFFTYSVDAEYLKDSNVLLNISLEPKLVVAGIWGATLSSALGSILGAPRILQATAKDKISASIFAKGFGPANEPRNALLLTFLIAEAGILIGDLNLIARLVSIFFITTYGFINISAAFEGWTSADFRPEFKVSPWISVIGAFACMMVMIQLDIQAMIGATIVLVLIFLYLKRRELTLETGDAWNGVYASIVKTGITRLKESKFHARNWRANVIMFSGNPNTRESLVQMGITISGKLGVLSAFELKVTNAKTLAKDTSHLEKQKDSFPFFMHKIECVDVYDGMDEVARIYGFPGLEPNTILMGWSKKLTNKEKFLENLVNYKRYNYSSIIYYSDPEKELGQKNTIDFWWGGNDRNLAFGLHLIRQISMSPQWKEKRVRLLVVNPFNDESEYIYSRIKAIIKEYRVEVDVKVINNELEKKSTISWITEESYTSDLILMGIDDNQVLNFGDYYEKINNATDKIGTFMLIHGSDEFEKYSLVGLSKVAMDSSLRSEVKIPELSFSKYNEITNQVKKIDQYNQLIFDTLSQKLLIPIFKQEAELARRTADVSESVRNKIKDAAAIKEQYRKLKSVNKIQSEVYYGDKQLLEKDLKESLVASYEVIEEAIAWYLQKIKENVRRFPKRLPVVYENEDFNVQKEDPLSTRLFKLRIKIQHSIIGFPIRYKVPFRRPARYYFYQLRLVLFSRYLNRMYNDAYGFFNELRRLSNKLSSHLNEVEKNVLLQNSVSDELMELFEVHVKEARKYEEERNKVFEHFKTGILVKARNNLQLFNDDLAELCSSKQGYRKAKRKSYYKKVESNIREFPTIWQNELSILCNKLLLDLSISSLKDRIMDGKEEFVFETKSIIQRKLINSIESTRSLVQNGLDKEKLEKVNIEFDFENELKGHFRDFKGIGKSLLKEVPRELVIPTSEDYQVGLSKENVKIPIQDMSKYYLDTRFNGPVENYFEEFLEKIRRSVLTTNDIINYTIFNIEDLNKTKVGNTEEQILAECSGKLEVESVQLTNTLTEFAEKSGESIEEAFEPLTSIKIEQNAREFQSDYQSYKGRKFIGWAKSIYERSKKSTKALVTRLLYARTEGILYARKLGAVKENISLNSKMLGLKEMVSPNPAVLQKLPHFYVNLFSSRFGINKDFWIERKEELAFKKAISRYQQGHQGGILVLGNRNSGKTELCRYAGEEFFKNTEVISILPPIKGTINTQVFESLFLPFAKEKGQNLPQIIRSLPIGTVVIINDLELFWERHEQGLEVIRRIGWLINNFSNRILFVVNTNPHFYQLVEQQLSISRYFIEIITLTPFDSNEIKDLILTRHRSSGLKFCYEDEKPINEIALAALFNSYFDYSRGNPGNALNGWLSHIDKVSSERAVISKPVRPSYAFFKELPEDWISLLIQFVLHKRLDRSKIVRVTGWERPVIEEMLASMMRSGLIVERNRRVFTINQYMYPFLLSYMKSVEVL